MILYFCVNALLSFFYATLIMRVWTSWDRIHHSHFKLRNRKDHQFISIIVIGRNEQDSIQNCLQSIGKNNYPYNKFEILFVDDHSEDNTVAIASNLDIPQLSILNLSDFCKLKPSTNSYKKLGIQYAISLAKGDIIVCTDADCVVPENWLAYIDYSMQQALIKMLVMPITFTQEKSIINRFQSLDMMATIAFTGYGIQNKEFYSANGANMAFRKSIYPRNGLQEEYASGDDIFLVQHVSVAYPDGIKFLKASSVIVQTKAERSWTSLYMQRKRWVSKSKSYSDNKLYKTQVFIFAFNLVIMMNLLLGVTIHSLFFLIALFQFFIKGIMDYLLLSNMSIFFNQGRSLKLYLISLLLFTPFILLLGILALSSKSFEWKGRRVR